MMRQRFIPAPIAYSDLQGAVAKQTNLEQLERSADGQYRRALRRIRQIKLTCGSAVCILETRQ